jgi:hypothetical protein
MVTYIKIEKKFLKKILSDLDAIIAFEKKMTKTLRDKKVKGAKMMEGAGNNTTRLRRELVEKIRNKDLIINE